MTHVELGQITASAAEVYEDFFVPALFAQWADPVLDAAGAGPGHRVLDVACGTGVLARAAARRVGTTGTVAGVDVNEGMLDVARHRAPAIEWHHGAAERLPFADHGFDRVVSQFGLMFFADRTAALREIARVARPGGRVALAVWASLDRSPGYRALTDLVEKLFGDAAAAAIRAPFVLGDASELRRLVAEVLPGAAVATREGTARFDSIESWLHTEIRGWTLAGTVDDGAFATLVSEAQRELGRFAGPDGKVQFPVHALIATAGAPA